MDDTGVLCAFPHRPKKVQKEGFCMARKDDEYFFLPDDWFKKSVTWDNSPKRMNITLEVVD